MDDPMTPDRFIGGGAADEAACPSAQPTPQPTAQPTPPAKRGHELPQPHQFDLRFNHYCQRWQRGRASYRPAGEPFEPARYAVQPVETSVARRYIETHHYARSFPAARLSLGLYRRMPWRADELVGVGVFSVPMNQRVIPAYFAGLAPNEGVELGRFCLDDSCPGNAESWTIARMMRLLVVELPQVRALLAFCDPVERRDEQGQLTKPGHVGTIYKATNAAYRGRSAARTLWASPSGIVVCERMLSKLRRGESGERYAQERLTALGAPGRHRFEDASAYVDRLKRERWLRPLRHPGNHAFAWSLSSGVHSDRVR